MRTLIRAIRPVTSGESRSDWLELCTNMVETLLDTETNVEEKHTYRWRIAMDLFPEDQIYTLPTRALLWAAWMQSMRPFAKRYDWASVLELLKSLLDHLINERHGGKKQDLASAVQRMGIFFSINIHLEVDVQQAYLFLMSHL